MTTAPKISVIIPHYNDPEGLRLCLDSLDRQTVPRDSFEIIVGDNNSPCGLAAVEAAVAGRAKIVVITEKGAGPARNGAAAEARGEVLAFTDSDCLVEPDWLAGGVAQLRPGYFLGGRMFVTKPAGKLTGAAAVELVLAFDNEGFVRRKRFTVTANLFVMRADFERVGGFRNAVSEDVEWCHRAIDAGLTIEYCPGAVVGHPPRPDWKELLRKTRRVERELYLFNREKPLGRIKWLARSLLLPGMILVDGPKLLRSPDLAGVRGAALGTLVRLRLWRCAAGVRQCFGFNL